jgi:hypothetical protein
VQLAAGQREVFSVAVQPGCTVEVAVAQYAIAEGAITLSVDLEFRGVEVNPSQVTLLVRLRLGGLPR